MKILLFGATGMLGQHIIDVALAHGHEVRAFGRNVFEELSTERTNLELYKGYLFTESDIKKAAKGVDAVLSAIGGSIAPGNKTRSLGMKKMVSVLEKKGPKRIIGVGGIGILDEVIDEATEETDFRFKSPDFPKALKFVTSEHFKAFNTLSTSSLDWTFVCPPNIIDAKASHDYVLEQDQLPEGKPDINAGDIAQFMVKELKNNAFLNCRVGIAANL